MRGVAYRRVSDGHLTKRRIMRGFVYEMKHATELALIWFVTFALAPISARVRLATVSLTLVCYLSLFIDTPTHVHSCNLSSGLWLALSCRSLLPVCRYLEVVSMLS